MDKWATKSWPLIHLDATATLGRCARSNPSFHSELETESSCCGLYEVHNSLRWQARCVFRLHPRFVLPYFDFKLENTLFCILLLLVSSFTRLLDSRHCLSGALGSGGVTALCPLAGETAFHSLTHSLSLTLPCHRRDSLSFAVHHYARILSRDTSIPTSSFGPSYSPPGTTQEKLSTRERCMYHVGRLALNL